MNHRNKKGATLPFVIIIGTALLLLSAALLALVNYSVNALKNTQDYAQGYVNARSAISFAQGVLVTDAGAGTLRSFYLTGSPTAAGALEYAANYGTPVDTANVYAVCTYTSATGAIQVYGYIKTPDYDKHKNIVFQTLYSEGVGNITYTNISSKILTGGDKPDITEKFSEISAMIDTSDYANKDVDIYTDFLKISCSSITIHPSSFFTIHSMSNKALVSVLVINRITIETSKKGKRESSFSIEPGQYSFINGSEITNESAWQPPQNTGAGGGFTGGVYH